MQSSGEEQQKDEREKEREGDRWKEEMQEGEGGRRWKEDNSRDVMQDGGRWRGGGEEGGEGVRQQQQERWKEEGVIRRGQVVAGARAKGEGGGRRGGVSGASCIDDIITGPAYLGGCGFMVLCRWVQAVVAVGRKCVTQQKISPPLPLSALQRSLPPFPKSSPLFSLS